MDDITKISRFFM